METAPTLHPFRRLYNWTIHWCSTPYAIPALCLVAFADASFFPIPPEAILIILAFAHPKRWWQYPLIALPFSLLGAIAGWSIGHYGWTLIGPWMFSHIPGFHQALFDKVALEYQKNAFLVLVGGPFTYIPAKVFTITSGICGVPLPTLLIADAIGRGARLFLVSLLIRLFGDRVRDLLENHFKKFILFAGLIIIPLLILIKVLHSHSAH